MANFRRRTSFGNLFRNTSGAKELKLIIMVTPEIIEDENLEIYQSNITQIIINERNF